jgi:hypothetical protein
VEHEGRNGSSAAAGTTPVNDLRLGLEVLMFVAESCVPPAFNISTTAGFYAQMTGLLSGFAFTAIVMLLTPTQVEEDRTHPQSRAGTVFLTMFAAFFALIVSTLIYSVAAGEVISQARGRAAAEEIGDGLAFGLAVTMLFHGITLLMQAGRVQPAAIRAARTVTIVVAPALTMYYLLSGVSDIESARAAKMPGTCPSRALQVTGLTITALVAALLMAALLIQARRPIARDWALRWQNAVPIGVLCVAIALAVWVGDLANRTPQFLISRNWLYAYSVVAGLLFLGIGFLLTAAWPPSLDAVRGKTSTPGERIDKPAAGTAVTPEHINPEL